MVKERLHHGKEEKGDIENVVRYTLKAVRGIASPTDLPEETAIARAVEGLMSAAESINPEVLLQVKKVVF